MNRAGYNLPLMCQPTSEDMKLNIIVIVDKLNDMLESALNSGNATSKNLRFLYKQENKTSLKV